MESHRRCVVLVPYPLQGHVTPMLQLASILHSKGLSIIIVHTEYNFPNPKNYPDFTFAPLSDRVAGSDVSFHDLLNIISIINMNCEASFQEYMAQLLDDQVELYGEVACVIYDAIMRFVDPVALQLKIPTIVLRTTTAAYIHSQLAMFQLEQDKVLPLPDCVTESQLEEAVPNLDPLRFKDLPFPATMIMPKASNEFLHSYTDIKSSSAVIWNTVEMLDQSDLKQLQQYWGVPFFPIGPFHKMAPPLPTSIMKEDTSCLSWLDKQAPKSVIYVSLGSLAIIDKKAFTEMAWGLANSEQPFLWVVRPSLLNSSEAMKSLPEDFSEKIKERGCIVNWAPQKEVLAHPSVGGFITHCGWNSTLESLCEGVPMICWPCFSDQTVNARFMIHVWKVGLELDELTERGIENAVRKLMVGEEGKEIRERVLYMKWKLEDSINEGGPSYKSLDGLVEFIISLSDNNTKLSGDIVFHNSRFRK